MSIDIRVMPEAAADADVVVTMVASEQVAAHSSGAFLTAIGFTGGVGETAFLPGSPPSLLVGLGPLDKVDRLVWRRAVGAFARAVRRFSKPIWRVPREAPLRVVTEAFLLASYRFTKYRSKVDPTGPTRLDLVISSAEAGALASAVASAVASSHASSVASSCASTAASAVAEAQIVSQAVILARDLVNEPGGALTPAVFADRAAKVAAASGLDCEVWEPERIAAERLGGLLGVSRGSIQPPRLVRLAYAPLSPQGRIALVGKGITFDTGGLSLKPGNMMIDMKLDMAGAAAVLGAMSALRDLACPTAAVAWLPLTDNMPGGDATRLGDVLRTRSGLTVEVRNADAEGRLVLADALALAAEERPDSIVDVATLTDTVPMAVGRRYGGLAGNDEAWIERVMAAARRAGELVWPLPMDGVDRKQLDSKIGDLVNATGNRYGQSAVAALFLKEFVPEDIPWAHLDIAGPAFSDEEDGETTWGGTGFGVRTLIELLRG